MKFAFITFGIVYILYVNMQSNCLLSQIHGKTIIVGVIVQTKELQISQDCKLSNYFSHMLVKADFFKYWFTITKNKMAVSV